MNRSETENIEKLLIQYRKFIDSDDYDELYKWEALQNFRDNWDIEAENFSEMLDNSLQPDNCNLWVSRMYYPKNMLLELVNEFPEDVRAMFKKLFNENLNLEERLQSFKKEATRLLEAMGEGDKSHYQDFRAITVYLSFRYPEKYYLYKYQMYKDFCEMTGLSPKPTRGADNNVSNYIEACKKVKTIIEEHPEVIEKHRSIRGSNLYEDPANHVLTQDLIYCSVNEDSIKLNEWNKVEEQTKDEDHEKIDYYPNLNQILYGPPGTGKTYNTLNHALAILENDESYLDNESFDRDDLHDLIINYKEQNQVRYVTFHPSFTYEDFVEGIKPTLQDENSEQEEISYEIKPGIFKQICESAIASMELAKKEEEEGLALPEEVFNRNRFFKISLGDSTNPDDDDIFQYCIENDLAAIGYLYDIDCTSLTSKKEIEKKAVEKGYSSDEFGIKALERFKLKINEGDVIFVSDGNLKLRAVGIARSVNGKDYYYDPHSEISYNHFRHVEWILTDLKIPVHDVYYARFMQQTIYELKGHKVKKDYFNLKQNNSNNVKRYVLVIDEINRGNVPSIFGELITLIEEDKRAGGDEKSSVILPYSKEETQFEVPSNLYIIGTMNTADRSVEALDVALRRRFEFKSFYPEPGKIQQPEDFEVELKALLTVINYRIEYLLDRDHTIGHSYFMKLHKKDDPEEELKLIFKNKIIPLLEEYFYGQLHNVGLILGDDFIITKFKEAHSTTLFSKNFSAQNTPSERVVYRIVDPTSFSSVQPFINIYDES